MGGQPLRLGPFVGALNTVSDPTAIADTELAEDVNFELDIDGSMRSRPPFKEISGHIDFTERIVFLCEAIFGTDHYLIGSNSNGVFYLLNGAVTKITATFEAGAAVQYADKVYLVPKPGSGNGGKWDPSGGFVAVAAIPKGQSAVIHKERLYIAPGSESTADTSRLKFSDNGNFDSWPGANFIDISQGDGTKLVDLTVYQDNLLLFKQHSTFLLAYDVRPTDAVLREISSTIGVLKQHSIVNYENQVYLIDHTGWIYEIINSDFSRINTKVPFVRDDTAPTPFADENIFLCLLEDRLICRFYRKIYVYGIRTRTWSEWESVINNLHYFGPVVTARLDTGNEYYAGSCLVDGLSIIQLFNESTSSTKEESFNTTPLVTDTYTRTESSGLGISDSGHTYTNSGGAVSEYLTNGTKAKHVHNGVNVSHTSIVDTVSIAPFDNLITVSTDALATGAGHIVSFHGRYIDASNRLTVQVEFTTTQTVILTIFKIVAGVATSLVTTTVGGLVHAAGTEFTIRFKGTGSVLSAKVWQTSSSQPSAWTLTATDSSILAAGNVGFTSRLNTGNTNSLPVNFSWDNLQAVNSSLTTNLITCSVRTKNFDMAVSHQFKRLWWWGADVSTNNSIIGIATPLTSSFIVTWDDLANYTWDDLNTWDQPLTAPSLVQTTQPTGSGTQRQFAKFYKGLRYRQINFKIVLTTNGSISDGPARLFTMTALTEAKQVVSKAVS